MQEGRQQGRQQGMQQAVCQMSWERPGPRPGQQLTSQDKVIWMVLNHSTQAPLALPQPAWLVCRSWSRRNQPGVDAGVAPAAAPSVAALSSVAIGVPVAEKAVTFVGMMMVDLFRSAGSDAAEVER